MNKYTRVGLPGLLLALVLALASCGGSGSAQQEESQSGGTQGGTTSGMAGMDHGSMEAESGSAAPPELIVDGEYSDERFVDMMAAHHQMAIEMAKVAQQKAELPEIKQIADDIVTTQQDEIEQLASIKEEQFGSSEVPTQMNPEEPSMFAMEMPDQLVQQDPFDLAFIDSMIPHHASAIEMASTANLHSDNPKIKNLARGVIDAQSKEIGQMIELRQQYYPEAHPLA